MGSILVILCLGWLVCILFNASFPVFVAGAIPSNDRMRSCFGAMQLQSFSYSFDDWLDQADDNSTQSSDSYNKGSCIDIPGDSWADITGYGCLLYANGLGSGSWCLTNGSYGPGWHSSWGTFHDWASSGVDASQACCSCGGGIFIEEYGACQDLPGFKWVDVEGNGCQVYENSQWCDNAGRYGAGWEAAAGTFSERSVHGLDATEACCACGGGCTGIAISNYHPLEDATAMGKDDTLSVETKLLILALSLIGGVIIISVGTYYIWQRFCSKRDQDTEKLIEGR